MEFNPLCAFRPFRIAGGKQSIRGCRLRLGNLLGADVIVNDLGGLVSSNPWAKND